jgi:anti-sigma regulatory factor (Ser/Thr protein kinase)
MVDSAEADIITLRVPAEAAYARLARVAGAGVAVRLGFTHHEVDQVRLAIGEAWAAILGSADHAGTVEITYCGDHGELVVELSADNPGQPSRNALCDRVLSRNVDQHWIAPDRRRARLRKRHLV